jgi:hypothetical protein
VPDRRCKMTAQSDLIDVAASAIDKGLYLWKIRLFFDFQKTGLSATLSIDG